MIYIYLLSSIICISFFVRYRKRVTYLHFIVLYFFYSSVLRNMAISHLGSSILYSDFYSDELFLQAQILNLAFFTVLILGIFLTFKPYEFAFDNIGRSNYVRLDAFLSVLLFSIFIIILGVGGSSTLAPFRDSSISAVTPSLRPIYPFALIISALVAARGFLLLMSDRRKIFALWLIFLGLTVTVVISQRGILISFIIVTAALAINLGRFRFALKVASIAIFLAVFLRSILSIALVSAPIIEDSGSAVFNIDLLAIILAARPDGDSAEVWMIASQFVESYGYLLGDSVINSPFSIFNSDFRRDNGFFTGLDVLNNFRDSDTYWSKKFGFNVHTSHELYINFGVFGLLPMFLIGLLVGKISNRYISGLSKGHDPIYSYLIPFALISALLAISAIVWVIPFLIIKFVIDFFSKSQFKLAKYKR